MKIISRHSTFTWIFIAVLFLLLVAVNTYLSRTTINQLSNLQSEISTTGAVLQKIEDTHINLLTAESGQRGYLLTLNTVYLEHYERAIKHLDVLIEDAELLESVDKRQNENIKTLYSLIKKKVSELKDTVNLVKREQFELALERVETDEGLLLYNQIHDLFDIIDVAENKSRDQQIAALKTTTVESKRNLNISFFTSLLLVMGLFFLAKSNIQNQQNRQSEIEKQNKKLKDAVEERTRELSLFSEELSRSNRELEDFAFVASHDLQEPLRKIMAFGDRIESQSNNLTEKQQDYLQRMRGAASRMSTLISDLLEFSRVNTRGKPFVQVDLNTVVTNSIEDLNVLIEETDAKISCDSLPSIIADPMQMQQLMFNLIANAVKFSKDEKHPLVNIHFATVEQPSDIEVEGLLEWFTITVTDNGIGFEQEYAEKIFAPFQRLHSRQSYKGTGIGLAICRRIVERHNGVISAHSEASNGAQFIVTLPAKNHLISIKQQ